MDGHRPEADPARGGPADLLRQIFPVADGWDRHTNSDGRTILWREKPYGKAIYDGSTQCAGFCDDGVSISVRCDGGVSYHSHPDHAGRHQRTLTFEPEASLFALTPSLDAPREMLLDAATGCVLSGRGEEIVPGREAGPVPDFAKRHESLVRATGTGQPGADSGAVVHAGELSVNFKDKVVRYQPDGGSREVSYDGETLTRRDADGYEVRIGPKGITVFDPVAGTQTATPHGSAIALQTVDLLTGEIHPGNRSRRG